MNSVISPLDIPVSPEIFGAFIGGMVAIVVAIIGLYGQLRNLLSKEKTDEIERRHGERERDARAAKDLGDALSSVVESLRGELRIMSDNLYEANTKIEHLTMVVGEYSRGLDVLIDQVKRLNETPAYTKRMHHTEGMKNSQSVTHLNKE